MVGLPSSGLHTNGYSLVRAVIGDEPFDADLVLAPHRLYLDEVRELKEEVDVRALAHITGGGIPGNLGRPLPAGLRARVDPGAWGGRRLRLARARRARGGTAAGVQPRDRLLRGHSARRRPHAGYPLIGEIEEGPGGVVWTDEA